MICNNQLTQPPKTFRFKLFDRRFGGEIGQIGGEVIQARTRTEARKLLAKDWKRNTPRDARNCGFVPWRDVRIVWLDIGD